MASKQSNAKCPEKESQNQQYPLRKISAHPFIRYASKETSKSQSDLRRTPVLYPMDYDFLSQQSNDEPTRIEINNRQESQPHQFKIPKMDTSTLPKYTKNSKMNTSTLPK